MQGQGEHVKTDYNNVASVGFSNPQAAKISMDGDQVTSHSRSCVHAVVRM